MSIAHKLKDINSLMFPYAAKEFSPLFETMLKVLN